MRSQGTSAVALQYRILSRRGEAKPGKFQQIFAKQAAFRRGANPWGARYSSAAQRKERPGRASKT